MPAPRLSPPFWQHDAYTLNRLAGALRQVVADAAAQLPATLQRQVVDLGAGEAPYRPIFIEHGFDYVCCDLGDDAQVPLRPGQPVSLGAGSAGLVVSLQVLEHVWDIDWYLAEARRLLDDKGWLVLSTHGTWLYHPHPTDYRRWTRTGLEAELRQRGFEPISVQGLVGPLAWTTQFRAIGFSHLLLRLPLIGRLLSALMCSVFHLRMKLEDLVTPQAWIDSNAAIYVVVARKSEPSNSPARAT